MFSKIRDNLYLAAFKDVTKENLKKNKITLILNVASELQTPRFEGISNLKYGFEDDAKIASDQFRLSVDVLKVVLSKGETVLVPCKAGASRSPFVCAVALSEIEGTSYWDAYEEVRSKHSRAMKYSLGHEIKTFHPDWWKEK